MSDYRFATKWAVIGLCLAVAAFLFNYFMSPTHLFGYEVITAPAMFALSFFSEETAFTPKMVIFLTGQFIGYFGIAWFYRKLTKRLSS